MKGLERAGARDALVYACCATCRPLVRQWFRHAETVDIADRLCPRCWRLVERMLLDLIEHYG